MPRPRLARWLGSAPGGAPTPKVPPPLDFECTRTLYHEPVTQTLTVQEVSTQTGLSPHTLRYYEDQGLVDGVVRTAGNARRYTAEAVSRLNFLQRMRLTGMPIRDLKAYVNLVRQPGDTNKERIAILKNHRARVVAQIETNQANLELIDLKLELYKTGACPTDLSNPCARRINDLLQTCTNKQTTQN